MVDFLPFFIYFARLVAIKDGSNRKNWFFFIFLNSFGSVCGRILTPTLEAQAKLFCVAISDRLMHNSFNSSISPFGEFSTP